MDSFITVFRYDFKGNNSKKIDVMVKKSQGLKAAFPASKVSIDTITMGEHTSMRIMFSVKGTQQKIFTFMSAMFSFAQAEKLILVNQNFYPKDEKSNV